MISLLRYYPFLLLMEAKGRKERVEEVVGRSDGDGEVPRGQRVDEGKRLGEGEGNK